MNKFTKPEQFLQSAWTIYCQSELFDNEEAELLTYKGVLYERLSPPEGDRRYRFFFSADDYDYLNNPEFESELDGLWSAIDERKGRA